MIHRKILKLRNEYCQIIQTFGRFVHRSRVHFPCPDEAVITKVTSIAIKTIILQKQGIVGSCSQGLLRIVLVRGGMDT